MHITVAPINPFLQGKQNRKESQKLQKLNQFKSYYLKAGWHLSSSPGIVQSNSKIPKRRADKTRDNNVLAKR